MPDVNMDKSPNYLSSVNVYTDAESYSAKATSIDMTILKTFDGPCPTYYYNLTIEWWDEANKYWVARKSFTGNFQNSVNKSFSLAGQPAGSYV